MSELLSGIWRNSDHTLLVQVYGGKSVPKKSESGVLYGFGSELQAMVWVIDRKEDSPVLGTAFISVLPRRETWIAVNKSVEHGPGIYEITASVQSNVRWVE
jgi:hypothetical protein